MTSIQIEYWKNMENQRHNTTMERLTGESQSEIARHNVRSEEIGFLQAQASSLAAQAAMKQAEIQYRLSQLQEIKTQYERDVARYQMSYLRAQTETQKSITSLNEAKTYQQQLESGVYAKYGAYTAASNLYYQKQQYNESVARTEYLKEQAKTEAYKRWQYATSSAKSGVDAWNNLWKSNYRKKKDEDILSEYFGLFG